MNENCYTEEYYNKEKNKYISKYLNSDIYQGIFYAYAAMCGTALSGPGEAQIPIATFATMAYIFLGKSLYDSHKVAEIDEKMRNNESLAKPLKLEKIKKYR